METIIKRGKTADYTIISNEALRDNRLSWKAKGLLSYIMSLPQEWKLNVKDLTTRSTDGRTATAAALNELIDAGYATREQVKEGGRFAGVIYTVTDTPQAGFLHTENLHTENLQSENLQSENLQLQINNKQINKKQRNIESTPTPENAIENDFEVVDVEEIPDLMTAAEPTPPSSAAPPRPKSASTKTLFRNSGAADRTKFFKAFDGEEYAAIDMEYYYNVVSDWSDSSNTMRTERGWFATVRTFIRGDKEKGKLHKKINAAAAAATEIDWNYAQKYLNM